MDSQDQHIRTQIDSLLQTVRRGLTPALLEAYRRKYSGAAYQAVIRKDLRHHRYTIDPAAFGDDDQLISRIDLHICLSLMLRRWDDLFARRLGDTGQANVKKLKRVRNKWAHPTNPISLGEALHAVEAAANLLEHLDCDEELEQLRIIQSRLTVFPTPPVQHKPPSLPEVIPLLMLDPEGKGAPDGETELVSPALWNGEYYVEVIERDGQAKAAQIPLQEGRVIVGRGSTAHICLKDEQVSRAHLLLVRNGTGSVHVTDLSSANGTTLDGRRLAANEAADWAVGQIITVGHTWLILRRGLKGSGN